jgi:hypothetical protein
MDSTFGYVTGRGPMMRYNMDVGDSRVSDRSHFRAICIRADAKMSREVC